MTWSSAFSSVVPKGGCAWGVWFGNGNGLGGESRSKASVDDGRDGGGRDGGGRDGEGRDGGERVGECDGHASCFGNKFWLLVSLVWYLWFL